MTCRTSRFLFCREHDVRHRPHRAASAASCGIGRIVRHRPHRAAWAASPVTRHIGLAPTYFPPFRIENVCVAVSKGTAAYARCSPSSRTIPM